MVEKISTSINKLPPENGGFFILWRFIFLVLFFSFFTFVAKVNGMQQVTYKNFNNLGPTQKYIAQRMLAEGYEYHHVAGVLGNAQQESGFNLGSLGDSGASFGLFQWNGSRRANLEKLARSTGRQVNDVSVQVDFLLQELRERGDDVRLRGTRDVRSATEVFMKHYERPGTPHFENRLNYANSFMNSISSGSPTPSTSAGINKANAIKIISDPMLTKHIDNDLVMFASKAKELFPDLKITSGYRPSARTKKGNVSRHSKGEALDFGAHDGFHKWLYSKDGDMWMKYFKVGLLDETLKKNLDKTGGSGPHFHVGKDFYGNNYYDNTAMAKELYKGDFSEITNYQGDGVNADQMYQNDILNLPPEYQHNFQLGNKVDGEFGDYGALIAENQQALLEELERAKRREKLKEQQLYRDQMFAMVKAIDLKFVNRTR